MKCHFTVHKMRGSFDTQFQTVSTEKLVRLLSHSLFLELVTNLKGFAFATRSRQNETHSKVSTCINLQVTVCVCVEALLRKKS
jgi:hypothetical protein